MAQSQPFPFAYVRAEVPVNCPAGVGLYVPLENAILPDYVTPLDWTTVTSVLFHVTRQLDTTTATWIADQLTTVTPGGLVAVYLLQLNDTYIACPYTIRPYAVTPGLIVPCRAGTLYVVEP